MVVVVTRDCRARSIQRQLMTMLFTGFQLRLELSDTEQTHSYEFDDVRTDSLKAAVTLVGGPRQLASSR